MLLRGGVDLAPGGAALDADGARVGVDGDRACMPRMSSTDAAVDHRGAGHAVAAAVDRQRQVVLHAQS